MRGPLAPAATPNRHRRMPIDFGAYDQYVLACVVIAGTALGVVLLLWLTQRSRYATGLRSFRGIAQNFLTVINVIFALNLAFLANDTWNAHDRALGAVFDEAGSLRTIVTLAQHLPDAGREAVRQSVATYASAATLEWPLLARRHSSGSADHALDAMLVQLSGERVALAVPPAVSAQMLHAASRVRDTRDLRIALSRTHVNPLKWLGMAFLGFLTMISIAMVHVEQPRAETLAVLLFAVAAAPTAAIILIHGNPFQQPMAVDPQPIAAVLELLRMAGPGAPAPASS